MYIVQSQACALQPPSDPQVDLWPRPHSRATLAAPAETFPAGNRQRWEQLPHSADILGHLPQPLDTPSTPRTLTERLVITYFLEAVT